jgi:hypothetical protein
MVDALNGMLRVPRAAQVTGYLRVRQALRHVYRRLRPEGERVEDFGKLLVIDPRLAAMFPPANALYRDYVGVFSWLAGRYRAGHYHGTMTFYWAREIVDDGIRAWRPLLAPGDSARYQEHTIEGALMSSVTDHVEGLGRLLSTDLDQAGAPSSEPVMEESR